MLGSIAAREGFALDITSACPRRETALQKGSHPAWRYSLPLDGGSGKLGNPASQGPVWLPPPLNDLLVGEEGSRAASIHVNCSIVAAALTSFANNSLPSPATYE